MTFEEILDHAITMLQRRGRLTYGTLKRQFQLDDAALEDLKNELIEGQRLAVDEGGNVLVWTGTEVAAPHPTTPSASSQERPPLAYTPQYLAAGHLVFGHRIAPQEENEYRVLSHVEPCFPGTLYMCQNPVLRWTTMIAQPQPLIEVFAEIPDFRRCRGNRHPLPAILSLACCAMLCGYRSYSAIAEWGRNYGTRIAHALGFTHNTPCAATLHTVLRHVDRDAVEAKLGAWAEGSSSAHLIAPSAGEAAIALDGKTLRGSRKQGAPGVHLLSALSHHLGLTLAQQGVDDKTNEITQVETVLHQLVLQGRVCTMDALLTQRQVAQPLWRREAIMS